ncbi:MAG: BACON domain-containing protein [Candidatus Cryptobacteroides sp.]
MKKIALLLALAVAAIACDNTPEIVPEIKCDVTEIQIPVTIDENTEDVTVSFTTNFAWTATVNGAEGWLVITPTKGDAGDAKITFVAESNTGFDPRTATLVIDASSAHLEIPVVQGQVDAFELIENSAKVGPEGGNVEIKANTNMDWTVEIPADVTWLRLADTKAYGEKTIALTVEPFDELDGERTAELTVKAAGAPVAFTLTQNGPSSTLWYRNVTSYTEYTSGTKLKLAKYGDKLAMLDGNKVLVLNPATGEYVTKIDLPQAMQSLCIDDAGNILLANDAGTGEVVTVYKADLTTMKPEKFIEYNTGNYYCVETGNLRVNGDITKNAVITATVSTGSTGAVIYWEVKDGKVSTWYWANTPSGKSAWGVDREVVVPSGATISDGLFHIAYSATGGGSDLSYLENPTPNNGDNKWVTSYLTADSDANFNSMSTVSYKGRMYLAYLVGCHVDFTWRDTKVVLLDVTNPATATKVYEASATMYVHRADDWKNLDWTNAGVFSDVLLTIEGDSLLIYYVDANFNTIACQRVPMK